VFAAHLPFVVVDPVGSLVGSALLRWLSAHNTLVGNESFNNSSTCSLPFLLSPKWSGSKPEWGREEIAVRQKGVSRN